MTYHDHDHVDGFQTCFGSAASAFEIIELAYIHCAFGYYPVLKHTIYSHLSFFELK